MAFNVQRFTSWLILFLLKRERQTKKNKKMKIKGETRWGTRRKAKYTFGFAPPPRYVKIIKQMQMLRNKSTHINRFISGTHPERSPAWSWRRAWVMAWEWSRWRCCRCPGLTLRLRHMKATRALGRARRDHVRLEGRPVHAERRPRAPRDGSASTAKRFSAWSFVAEETVFD